MNKVRVRFAPSPTGPLHMGGVRTALFNYLFAKKHDGDFLLRIEDTDQKRYVEGAEAYIVESLKWCGIVPDEGAGFGGDCGPYHQSQRKDFYVKYYTQLVASGWAYTAFDTAEELDEARAKYEAAKKTFVYNRFTRESMKNSLSLSTEEVNKLLADGVPSVVRFKMPENRVVSNADLIRGNVSFNTDDLDDKVLFKADGLPTYHLANVVDDRLMKISHVIRGEEWLPSLPLHVLLYEALGWLNEMPQFAHLPLILKPVGKGKLSKRDGDKLGFPVFPLKWTDPKTQEEAAGYKEAGYYPEAFVNMLALLGWNPGTEQELFSLEELTQIFSLERVGKSGSKFDPEKTKWFNHQYLINKSDQFLADEFALLLDKKGITYQKENLTKIVSLVKERVNFVSEMWDQTSFFFVAPTEFDAKTIKKRWKEDTPQQMLDLSSLISGIDDFSSENCETLIKQWITDNELNMGAIMNAFRLSIVGEPKGPHMFDIIALIGKDETLQRLQYAIDHVVK